MSDKNRGAAASGGAIYALGIFGAWVWFFGQAHTFWAFILAFFQGLSHSELASHMRKPLGTVKTHIRRGLMKLKDCLVRHGTAEGRR